MARYDIVDWIFETAPVQYAGALTFTRRQKFLEELKSIAESEENIKGNKRLKIYLSKGDILENTSEATGRNISEEIDSNNEGWKDSFITRINRARDMDDIGTIRSRLEAERGSYEEPITEDVERAIIERESALVSPEDTAGEIEAIEEAIRTATTFEELNQKPTSAELRRRYGRAVQARIQELFSERLNQFESLEERTRREITSQINTAETLADLNRIDLADIPTARLEDDLLRMIQEKRNELV